MLANGRIPSLDGFRAISILLVIGSHLVINRSIPSEAIKLLEHFSFGGLGVRIFFVISGFLITYLLLIEKERTGSIHLKFFYIRRILRIFPVFYTYLLVLAIINLLLNLQIPFLAFLSGALYIQNFAPWGSNWFIEHSWSLSVEEQFYILWPIIFVPILKLNKPVAWISALGVGSLMRMFHYKYPDTSEYFLAPFFMHADFLFSGCFMAFFLFYNQEDAIKFIGRIKPILVYISVLALWFFSKFEFTQRMTKFLYRFREQ